VTHACRHFDVSRKTGYKREQKTTAAFLDRDHRMVSEDSGRQTTSIDDCRLFCLLPEISRTAFWDFCNRTGTYRTSVVLPTIRFAPKAHIRSRPLTISSIRELTSLRISPIQFELQSFR